MEGKLFGNRYEIICKLGSGGMANVYQARCTILNRVVTVKVLKSELAADKDFMRRFQVEAEAVASLSHPNIVSIYDVGEENGIPYLVMEYVEGKNLKEIIEERGPLTPGETANIGIQVCAALAHAHSKGIIHRDIKPHNIMVSPTGQVKVTDFGLARVLSVPSATMTQSGTVMGSVHYFSPEQARGEETSPKTDLYALGVVLYEAVCGHVPFQGDNPVSIAVKHLQEQPPSLRKEHPEIPRELEAIIFKAMAKDPEQRFNSARQMQSALSAGAYDGLDDFDDNEHTRVLHLPVDQPEYHHKPKRRLNPLALAALITCGVLLLAGAAWALWYLYAPSDAVVPDVTHLAVAEAQTNLRAKGLKVETFDTFDKEVAQGFVARQLPLGNTLTKKGRSVKIWVSKGPNMVWLLSVREYPLSDARRLLSDSGFKVSDRIEEAYDPQISAGKVIKQIPEGNQNVSAGTEIILTVSKGPQPVNHVMPSLVGQTVEQATATLTTLGLVLGQITDEQSYKYLNGVITGQVITPGTPVNPGDTINVTRSQGPGPQKRTVNFKVNDTGEVKVVIQDSRGSQIAYQQVLQAGDEINKDFDVVGPGVIQVYFQGQLVKTIAVQTSPNNQKAKDKNGNW